MVEVGLFHASEAKSIAEAEGVERTFILCKSFGELHSIEADGLPLFWDKKTNRMQFQILGIHHPHANNNLPQVEIEPEEVNENRVAVRKNLSLEVKQSVCDAVDFLMS